MPGLTLSAVSCPFCGATFSSRAQAMSHLINGHNIVQNVEEVFQLMETGTRTTGREYITVLPILAMK